MYGAEKLFTDLIDLGFQAEILNGGDNNQYVVMRKYEVLIGRFAGQVIDLAIMAMPDYPRNTASAIHIKAEPQLLEKSDSLANVRNITDSPLGTDWRYWSHNFNWTDERSTRRLISQINTIFKDV